MTPGVKRTGTGARRTRCTSHTSERGAAIFVVILVLTILTAIGIFAARAAGLNQRTSGYARQSTQTSYVAEYGTLAVVDEFSGGAAPAYMQLVLEGNEGCRANQWVTTGGADAGLPCYKLNLGEIQQRTAEQGGATALFDPNGGSLGAFEQPVRGDFNVEITDPGPAGRPVAGMDQGGTGPRFRYMQVTMTGAGQVRPVSTTDPDAGICGSTTEQSAAQMAAMRANRAVVQVGPLPE